VSWASISRRGARNPLASRREGTRPSEAKGATLLKNSVSVGGESVPQVAGSRGSLGESLFQGKKRITEKLLPPWEWLQSSVKRRSVKRVGAESASRKFSKPYEDKAWDYTFCTWSGKKETENSRMKSCKRSCSKREVGCRDRINQEVDYEKKAPSVVTIFSPAGGRSWGR